jgi:hypothetical protein
MADVAASLSVVARDIIDSTQLRYQIHASSQIACSVWNLRFSLRINKSMT